MNKGELLCPAGSLEIGKAALYNGADAIYLALESYGARAYAKNFTFEELEEILKIAHTLKRKVYVTVNTLIKNSELESVYNFIDKLYELGVDAIICADIAVFMYVINNCDGLDCHISTQVGVKDVLDAKFFESINAKRVVVARENNLNQIKEIKDNTNIELEVFVHGALCVSYSGGCLFSSLLSLRSGNRGRCSQNCRREYQLYENGTPISKPEYLLSMKDLFMSLDIKELTKIGVDSFKIEGRMKNINYVDVVSKYYRAILDGEKIDSEAINKIFHRQYTKGFILGEDSKNIATIKDSSSQGIMVGKVINKFGNKIVIKSNNRIMTGDRLRILFEDNSTFITVSKLYNEANILVDEAKNIVTIECNEAIKINSIVYKMNDGENLELQLESKIIPLTIFVTGHKGDTLSLTANIYDQYVDVSGDMVLEKAMKNPVTEENIYKQLSKLNDTPFFIDCITYDIDDDMFISISEINNLRRKLVERIYSIYHSHRESSERKPIYLKRRNINYSNKFVVTVRTVEQFNACLDMGIDNIFFENVSPYVNSKYSEIEDTEVLVGNYGGLLHYDNKIITSDYSFNVMNKDSILHLLNFGVAHITLSPEISFTELKEISNDFYNTYGTKAPIDYNVYGRTKLMTMKYCPLKRFGLCGKCRNNEYHLVDKLGKFIIKTRSDCYVEIYNDIPLNLIEEISKVMNYVDRLRFDFVTESYDEVIDVLSNAVEVLNNSDHLYKKKNQTKGYFKRPIL